jgi:hypothetical protein
MNDLLFQSKLTKNLKKKEIRNICKLKNTHWRHGVKSQIKWFETNIKEKDIHNLAYLKGKLVGYVSLRKRNFFNNKKKNPYLYFDTLIVSKKYRKFNIGNDLLNLTNKVIKKSKLHSMLICKKKIIPFYKKYKWKMAINKKTKILDHKYSQNLTMMCFNRKQNISKNNIKYYIFN